MRRRRGRALSRRYGRTHVGEAEFCPTGSRVQALLFLKDRFSLKQAKAWAQRHNWRSNDVDATDEYIHLRQEDPSKFERIRTVFLGGRGVQARVGWPVC
jgi:hypothetical protein